MRIIAGKYKGRKLSQVGHPQTRPTSDKIKEAIFHVLGPYFTGGKGLDLFAGSGALGIEALSRGLDSVIFIDHANAAIKTIHKNVNTLALTKEQAKVYRNDAKRALYRLAQAGEVFDIIFVDPPYQTTHYNEIIHKINKLNLIQLKGYIYIEHPPLQPINYDEHYFKQFFQRDYSESIAVTIIQAMKTND